MFNSDLYLLTFSDSSTHFNVIENPHDLSAAGYLINDFNHIWLPTYWNTTHYRTASKTLNKIGHLEYWMYELLSWNRMMSGIFKIMEENHVPIIKEVVYGIDLNEDRTVKSCRIGLSKTNLLGDVYDDAPTIYIKSIKSENLLLYMDNPSPRFEEILKL